MALEQAQTSWTTVFWASSNLTSNMRKRMSVPNSEGPRESDLIGIVEQPDNFGHRHIRAFQKLLGHLAAYLLNEVSKRCPFGRKATRERAPVDTQQGGCVVDADFVAEQLQADEPAHFLDLRAELLPGRNLWRPERGDEAIGSEITRRRCLACLAPQYARCERLTSPSKMGPFVDSLSCRSQSTLWREGANWSCSTSTWNSNAPTKIHRRATLNFRRSFRSSPNCSASQGWPTRSREIQPLSSLSHFPRIGSTFVMTLMVWFQRRAGRSIRVTMFDDDIDLQTVKDFEGSVEMIKPTHDKTAEVRRDGS